MIPLVRRQRIVDALDAAMAHQLAGGLLDHHQKGETLLRIACARLGVPGLDLVKLLHSAEPRHHRRGVEQPALERRIAVVDRAQDQPAGFGDDVSHRGSSRFRGRWNRR